jgi:hypothetical protein
MLRDLAFGRLTGSGYPLGGRPRGSHCHDGFAFCIAKRNGTQAGAVGYRLNDVGYCTTTLSNRSRDY